MRILLTGASGMIGSALVDRLAHRGHELVLAVRDERDARQRWPAARIVRAGFGAAEPPPWSDYLRGVDVVINAVGIFREQAGQSFDAVHVNGPLQLFRAACDVGVRQVVQISALGAHPSKTAPYLASKGRADAALAALPIRSTIVQPSLVFAPDGASSQWFAALAVLPLTPLPGDGKQRIQPLHLDDLCEAIVGLLERPDPPPRLRAVGPAALTLRRYLALLKHGLGAIGGCLPIPLAPLRLAGRLLGPRSGWLAPDALDMLQAGSTAPPDDMHAALGRAPRAPEHFVHAGNRARLRQAALLQWLLPALRWSIALMWIVTGYVSAFAYPVADSLALLARTGLHGGLAVAALYAAAALDAALGLALLCLPRWRRHVYAAQLLLIGAYTVLISAFLPEYWLHPYGPILKNLPLLAAIALASALEPSHGPHRR
ncbi:SDR family oxidoreductase [Xanthomonas sp. NCPPB 2654]|uniref:SDR family oxidoreductase n=1 Tax=unclassified Xanthomonas TaxID=2643310 RepID=UPI0021DFCEEE|nr:MULTISPECIES: SDR family oxidoreductase [unclassified Xanthomonas]MDL5367975.1 SDR family oxidoreductase [Xanthomonas sp. NCPPB 2654]UYC22431.1 SDR family oxidoreductase [Xanthomonas sp. CFBP 8443]